MTLPPRPDDLPARLAELLGHGYRLDRELSGGGMSRVFVAHEMALKRDVVVKVLPPDLLTSRSLARFEHEIEVTARLQHPHIVPVLRAGGEGSLRYFITPYVRGESLRARLAEGPLPPEQALGILRELLGAVAFAHRRGVAHRDIKPGNVLLSEGHALLADFGIARALAEPDDGTPPSGSSAVGGEAYLAPERPRDHTADLYALATLGHELLPGARPEVAAVLAQARHTDPARRFRTAEEFLDALARASGGRRRPLVAAAFVLGLGLAGLVGMATLRHPEAPAAVPADRAPTPSSQPAPAESIPATPPAAPAALPDARARLIADLGRGRVAEAGPRLDSLLAAHPADPSLRLWRALLLTWSAVDAPAEEALRDLTRARADAAALTPRERALADGLAALQAGRPAEACGRFEAARRMHEDFTAWLGLADCRRRDDLVVTGADGALRFRGDWTAAADAYTRALRLMDHPHPSVVYRLLANLLVLEPGRARRGVDSAGRSYFGLAVARGDSIAWDLQPPGPRRMGPDFAAANQRAQALARARLLPLLVNWARAEPRNAAAHEMLAEALEASGNIREPIPSGETALGEVVAARRLASAESGSTPADALVLALAQVRVLLRAREFAAAAALADSLLDARPVVQGLDAELFVSLAALTGRLERAGEYAADLASTPARLLRAMDGTPIDLPPAALRDRSVSLIRAAAGICDEGIRTLPARLEAQLDASYPADGRPRGAESALVERPAALAIGCLGADGFAPIRAPMSPFVRMARALAGGDSALPRGMLAAVDRARAEGAPPSFAEAIVPEAELRLVLGDTAGARRALALLVDGLPAAARVFFSSEVNAAALPRALALQAELAAATGDSTTAAAAADAALSLWAHADPALAPTVERLRALRGR